MRDYEIGGPYDIILDLKLYIFLLWQPRRVYSLFVYNDFILENVIFPML